MKKIIALAATAAILLGAGQALAANAKMLPTVAGPTVSPTGTPTGAPGGGNKHRGHGNRHFESGDIRTGDTRLSTLFHPPAVCHLAMESCTPGTSLINAERRKMDDSCAHTHTHTHTSGVDSNVYTRWTTSVVVAQTNVSRRPFYLHCQAIEVKRWAIMERLLVDYQQGKYIHKWRRQH